LYDKLEVRTLDDLRRILKVGRLSEIRGFGPAIEKKMSAALEKPPAAKRFKLAVAEAEALVGVLRDGRRVVVAGSDRRRRDMVGGFLVTAAHGAAIGDKLVRVRT
jgi:DNA polymerase (family 10)